MGAVYLVVACITMLFGAMSIASLLPQPEEAVQSSVVDQTLW
jgi:hypothetical protein